MDFSMDTILGASFGEASSKIRATFKKTVKIRDYETEVIEVESTLDMGEQQLSGVERVLVSATLQAQVEYGAYCNLCYKGLVTQEELYRRRENLTADVKALKEKAEAVTGQSMDKYFK